ncbi:hypothetical protein GUJ93_ZPchr0004g39098 [Zizania palustris]|uniref:Uncharacterized protein n=1 Tax=Zizania palustris TaxID=103762 RepID=A0A8J5VPM5_ZIZPA|nr:hypothetical protein GUJ93_ZPchr0004g39098 [Zizania palustris]
MSRTAACASDPPPSLSPALPNVDGGDTLAMHGLRVCTAPCTSYAAVWSDTACGKVQAIRSASSKPASTPNSSTLTTSHDAVRTDLMAANYLDGHLACRRTADLFKNKTPDRRRSCRRLASRSI